MAVTVAHGFQSILGIGEEVTAGTPVAATVKVPFLSEDLTEQFDEILDNSLCGTAARTIGQQGTQIVEGGFDLHWRYTLNFLLMRHFFGTLLADTPVVGTNTYQFDSNIDGNALTVAIEKTVSVWEFAGFKVDEMVISGNPTDGIQLDVDGFAVDLDLASVINTTASLGALSLPGPFMTYQDMRFRIGDLVDALASPTDDIQIADFEITLARNLEATTVNSQQRLEALENDFRDAELSFTIPRYCSNFFVTAHQNHTPLQADIFITDGTNSKTIRMPKLIVLEAPASVDGPGFIEQPVVCQIIPDPEGANTFMTLQDTNSEIEIQEN